MKRVEIYKSINFCGDLSYNAMINLLESVKFKDISNKLMLQQSLSVNGKLSRSDWMIFVNELIFKKDATITSEIALGWLDCQSKFLKGQLIQVLENVEFEDGEQPTIYISGGLILTKTKI